MSSDLDGLKDYHQLLAKVDAKFSEIHKRNASFMKCGRGCSSCCTPDLSVFEVERESIRRFIEAEPSRAAELRRLESARAHQGQRCRFLDVDGSCAIYEVRPVICRSHGAPIFSKSQAGEVLRDVCPLNFESEDIDSILADDFINLDLLNSLLTLINQRFGGSGRRFELSVSGILDRVEN